MGSGKAVSKNGQEGVSVATRGTVQVLISRGCILVTGYLISIILARGLGPINFGVYGVILSVLTWVEIAATSGISRAVPKLMPTYEKEMSEFDQAAPTLMFIVAAAFFLPCWWFAPIIAELFNIPTGTTLFRLAILDLPFYGLYIAYMSLLTGYRRFGELSASLIIYGSTHLLGIVYLLLFLELSVAGALLVNVAATVGALGFLLTRLPPKRWQPAYRFMTAMVRTALPFTLLIGAAALLANLDLWALKSLWKDTGEAVGIYVAALKVAKLLAIVPIAVSDVLFPSLSWALTRREDHLAHRHLQAATRLALIVLLPSGVLLAQHAEEVMILLFSQVYASGAQYLQLLIIATILFAFLDIFILSALPAAGRYGQSVGLGLFLIPIALLLNFLLIPRFGPIGAASSLVLVVLLGTTLAAIFAYRRFGSLVRLSTMARVSLATTGMALVGQQIPSYGLLVLPKFVGLLALYLLLLGLLKEVEREDLKSLGLWQRNRYP